MARVLWTLHGDGKQVTPGKVVAPNERLAWPRMASLGLQHVIAMFGATTLVPVLTGFPVSTTLFFSGIGTMMFILITRNRLPSYTGSAFAFIAPVLAAQADGGYAAALCGLVAAGIALMVVGLLIDRLGSGIIEKVAPPVVIGTIVAVVGLNLSGAAYENFKQDGVVATITLLIVLGTLVFFRGFISRLAIFMGVLGGYIVAIGIGKQDLDFTAVNEAAWIGLPEFTTPTWSPQAILLIVPAVLVVLVVENAAHAKAVGSMCDIDMDPVIGRAVTADGAATAVSGMFGGTGQITYAENIGVMALSRVYSTAAYLFAAMFAILLSVCPKFGALVAAVPLGVLGGVSTILFGMIACMGLRMYVVGNVDFRDPVNLTTAAIGLIIGTANYTWTVGDYAFGGIALCSVATIVLYHALRYTVARRSTDAGLSQAGTAEKSGNEPAV